MAKRHSRKSQEPKRLVHKLNTIGSRLRITKTVGSIVLLKAMAEKMGIRALVDSLIPMEREVGLTHGQVVEAMVINRCHAPVPLYEMDAWCNSSGYSDLCGTNSASYNDDRNRSALDVLSDYTVDLQANLVMHMVNTFQIPTNDVLYDLTSLYFEGDYDESQLVDYGYSRDQKPDKKQVNLGLTTTKQGGIPLYSQTLKGNTSDPATVEDNANALRRVLHRSNFLQITDGGMLTPANVHILEQQGIEFLAPWQADTAILDILESHPIEWTEMPYHSKKGNDSYWATELGIPVVYKEPLVDQPSPERSSGQRGKLPKYQVQNHIHWERAIIIRSSTKQALDAKTRSKHQQKITEALNNIGTGLNKRRLKTRVQVETKFNMLFSGNLATYRNCLILDLTGMDGEMELTWSWNDEAIKRLEARDGIYICLRTEKILSSIHQNGL